MLFCTDQIVGEKWWRLPGVQLDIMRKSQVFGPNDAPRGKKVFRNFKIIFSNTFCVYDNGIGLHHLVLVIGAIPSLHEFTETNVLTVMRGELTVHVL